MINIAKSCGSHSNRSILESAFRLSQDRTKTKNLASQLLSLLLQHHLSLTLSSSVLSDSSFLTISWFPSRLKSKLFFSQELFKARRKGSLMLMPQTRSCSTLNKSLISLILKLSQSSEQPPSSCLDIRLYNF